MAKEPRSTRVAVKSSNIKEVGYDSRTRTLTVQFVSGDTYTYSKVPVKVFGEFVASPSKGRFLNSKIKGKYPYGLVSQPAA